MSKRISQNVRKKVACALVTSMVIGSSCNLASADNGFDNASYKDIGYISVAGEVGIHGNAGFISTGEGDAGGKSYGVSQFTSKGGGASANGFVKWLKKAYPEMGKNFDGVGRAGSSSFDNAWKKTYNENKDEFGRVQMEYTGKNYVDPFVSKAKSEFGVDFKSTRALLELAYSTTVQFGVKGTMDVFRNAGINSSMSEIEILENATAEKIRSVGTYKFLGCSQNIRNGVRKRFAREIEEFKDIVEGTANIEGEGAITLDDLVNGNTNNTKPSLDDLVNGETDNTDSSLDDLVNGETDNTDSSLDDLVNGETDNKEDSPLDDLVNGETDNKEDSPLDDLVNGDVDSADKEPTTEGDNKEEVDSEVDSNEPTVEDDGKDESKEDNKKEDSPLDDLVNGEPSEENDKETNVDNTVDSNEEVSTENKPSSDKESTLDDLVTEDDTEKDDADSDENTQDTPNEDTDSSVEEEPVKEDKEEPVKEDKEESAQEELVEESSLDDLVNGESSEESNKTEDNSSNEIKEDTSDDKPTEDDKKDITEDDKSIEDNKNNTTEDDKSIEDSKTAIKAETVSSLEEKLENNMFGKLFKITKEIMENENGVDGVKAMYDLV